MANPKARAALPWLMVVLLPVLGTFLRYRGHSSHAFDPETSLAFTAAREWVHGRIGFLPHYHLNLHQGSQIVDGLLAIPGLWLFGDHTMAWGFVGLFWVAVTAAAGGFVLQRLVGWSAVWVWSALLALAPFLVKDGLMALSGGHPPVAGIILASLALSLLAREAEGRRALRWAFLAGAVVGVGTWYTRSVVVAGPCVLVALWPPARVGSVARQLVAGSKNRRVQAGVAGMALFAAALVGTYALHKASRTRGAADDHFVQRLVNPIVEMEGCTGYEIEHGLCEESESAAARLLGKTSEFLGINHIRLFWLQPRSLVTGQPVEEWHNARDAAGVVWVLGLVLGIPLFGWGVAAGRIDRSALLVLFACGVYLALYLLTSMRVEEAPESFWQEAIEPPTPTNVRYLIPSWLLLVAVLSAGIGGGLAGGGAARWLSGGLLAALVVSGAALSVRDVAVGGAPSSAFAHHQAFRYFLNYVDGRGPPKEAHQVCGVTDPISRANHLRSWATFNWCDMTCLMHDYTESDDELRWLVAQAGEVCGEPVSVADQAFIAHGMGLLFGAQAVVMENEDIGITVLRAFGVGENLDEEDARWFFQGVLDALWDYGTPMPLEDAVGLFCRETKWGTRPLCPLVGIRTCEWESPTPPSSPNGLCADFEAFFGELPPEAELEVVRGVGRAVGYRFGDIDRDAHDWSQWSRPLEDAFMDGVRSGGRWRWRNEPMEYVPNRVP